MIDTATLSVKLRMISWICKLYMISWICKLYMISWICKLYMISWICKLYMISWICKLYDCSLLMIYRRTDASMTSLTINNILPFLSYETNKINVTVWQFSNISQMASKRGKNVTTFLFLPCSGVICDLLLQRRNATWNLQQEFWFWRELCCCLPYVRSKNQSKFRYD